MMVALPMRAPTLTSTTMAQTSPLQRNRTTDHADKHDQPRPLNEHTDWRDAK
ncbi:hypothetical protein [Bradyrhizobium sp. RP6]|uniref:hypothetical protein n=1 Tax=Bradyrhizobium sp. RP6 TaxID=2489596 RepID=UPI0013158976|nr:hypothetical protein [Bradyrhizobium sp. RP6]